MAQRRTPVHKGSLTTREPNQKPATQGSKPEEKMKVTEIAWLKKKLSKKKLRPALTKRFAQRLAKLEAIKKAIEESPEHAS